MSPTGRAAALAALLCAGLARADAPAGVAPPAREPTVAVRAPASTRGQLVLEPPRISVGDVAQLEQIVVTPPGVSVRPTDDAPPELVGLWVLARETLPVERDPQRWIHRTRLRLRARDVGTFAYPTRTVLLEREDGGRETLEIPGRTIEVVSVLPEFGDRDAPFGLRGLPGPAAGRGGALVPALAGALFTLATLALIALVRRDRARRTAREAAAGGVQAANLPAAEVEAAESLDAAAAAADPRRAAQRTSRALRRFAERRFATRALHATTEELALARPPYATEERWDALLALLRVLDEVQFQPPEPLHEQHWRDAWTAARAFVGAASDLPR